MSRLRGVSDVLAAEVPVPGEQLVDASDRMIGDAGEDVSEPCLGGAVVEFGGDDQAVEQRGALAATIGPGEQPGPSAQRKAPQRPLGSVAGQADAAVFEEVGEDVQRSSM